MNLVNTYNYKNTFIWEFSNNIYQVEGLKKVCNNLKQAKKVIKWNKKRRWI